MIHTLSNVSLEDIHDAFIDAFSEYEVKMDMPIEKLDEMMTTRSFSKRDSIGYFKDGRLLGFILIGLREIENERVYYDVATGVRKESQGEGIGDALLHEIPKRMKGRKVDRFVLEVLENNVAAQSLYRKHGFKKIRRLKCYEYSYTDEDIKRSMASAPAHSGDGLMEIDSESFCTFAPSWQNSLRSYADGKDYYSVHIEEEDNAIIGYGIVHKKTGSILQIGLDPSNAQLPIASRIIKHLCSITESKKLKYLNVEEGSAIENLLESFGFANFINQFEMEFRI